MEHYFDHEKLNVYQEALKFVQWLEETILKKLPKTLAVREELDEASTSMVLNMAEGNGKYTGYPLGADRCKFFDISKASALECASSLDVLVAKKFFTKEDVHFGKKTLRNVFSMLVGLIKSSSPGRIKKIPKENVAK